MAPARTVFDDFAAEYLDIRQEIGEEQTAAVDLQPTFLLPPRRLDVAQGRRCWFGVRPRSAAEWEALSADWQRIFTRVSIGLFHAPAWADVDPRVQVEAFAVADAYMAVRRSFWQRCLVCCTIVLGYVKPKQHVISRHPSQALPNTQTYQGYPP